MFYYIEPEVSGGLGNQTIMDTSQHPPLVSKLHYDVDGWLGDDLIESFPCYAISENLKLLLAESHLTGFKIEEMVQTESVEFGELYPNKTLPKFNWLKINGVALEDDFGVANDYRLVISKAALDFILNSCQLNHADIELI